jgi:biotin carboxyl carrier protein
VAGVNQGAVRVSLSAGHEPLPALVVGPSARSGGGLPTHLVWIDDERASLEPERIDVLIVPPEPGQSTVAAPGVLRREVVVEGWRFEVDVEPEARALLRERASRGNGAAGHRGPSEVRAIIPGRILSIAVSAGDRVEAAGQLMVIEAMKMQNELRAPRSGTVARIAVAPGQTVEVGDLLLVLDAAS